MSFLFIRRFPNNTNYRVILLLISLWIAIQEKRVSMYLKYFFDLDMSTKEAQARIKINKLLEKSGWRFIDDENWKMNISLEPWVTISKAWDDFENISKWYIDYLLLDDRGFPICVLEAKKESIHPLSAKEQARDYAKGKNVKFVILSNGNAHYFWDIENWNPEMIVEFPTLESLQRRIDYIPKTEALAHYPVDEKYVAPVRTLRYYQLDAIKALQKSALEWNTRYLFEMATGTGKTTTAGAVCKLFLQSWNAKRILFLVDRIELERQAVDDFNQLFENQYFVNTIKSDEWSNCHIVVSTIQTLMAWDRYKSLFSPTDFELVISDEAHRSIGGNSRAVFEYFIGYKLGLTATPKDYLKWIDKEENYELNPKAMEIRNLRDTYKTFGCDSWEPTYRYDLSDGVKDGFLINPFVIDARTEITTELLSEEWYTFTGEDEDGNEVEENYGMRDFEKSFFNEQTNEVFTKAIIENGLLDPITGEFWKMLVFCVSVNHAAKITNMLNKLAMEKYPWKYKSDFALQVTSNVKNAQDFTKDFKYNRLSWKSLFAENTHPDYGTSKTRVCVTVWMMTTWYDCSDILWVVLLRPIFSPADFVQMKGRGTRKNTFHYIETWEVAEKDKFLLLDFFWNCEYFEKDFDYNKKLDLPQVSKSNKPIVDIDTSSRETIDADEYDEILTETTMFIGKEWMKIDRELYRKETSEQFEHILKNSKTLQDAFQEKGVSGVEDVLKKEVFDRPSEFWTPEKIRQSYERVHRTERKIWLREMIAKWLWLINKFEDRNEKLDTEWQKFISTERPNIDTAEQLNALRDIFETYLSDSNFREIIHSKRFWELASNSTVNISEIQLVWTEKIECIAWYSQEYLWEVMNEFNYN